MINKKRKKKKNEILLVLIISFILVLLMYFSKSNKYIVDVKKYFHNIGANIEEIFILKKETINNDVISGINNGLEKENNELKELLNLDKSELDFVGALVIDRSIDWDKTIKINKGSDNGIEEDMAVINGEGLIGKITEVGINYSIVTLITSNLDISRVAVDVVGTENYHGILNGLKKEENLLVVDNINKSSEINIGDNVYTNGLGGIYPANIYIGKVVDITYDEYGIYKQVYLKYHNLNNLNYVYVIGDKR